MDEYISREVLISKIEKARLYISEREKVPYKACLKEYVEFLKMIPAADVAERKHGKWVLKTFTDEYGEYQLYECNQCGAVTAQRKSKNYCYNCGAKMESEEEK